MTIRTRRFVALLCVLCMLITSMPSSVLSDTVPATPTDIQQTEAETPAGEQPENPAEPGGDEEGPGEDPTEVPGEEPGGEPEGEPAGEEPGNEGEGNPEEGRGGEPAADEPAAPAAEEPAAEEPAVEEPAAEEPAEETPSDETSEEEPEEEKEKIPANRELVIGDDVTITGELTGEKPADYLIRFSTDVNQIMFVFLKSDKELTATVTDEETDKVINFKREETEQGDPVTLTVEYTKFKSDRTYLVRISAAEEASFSLRLVKKSILAKELEARAAAEAAGDEQPEDEQPAEQQPLDEQPLDEQPADEQPADEQPADEQPADEQPADEQPADEQPADEQPADEQPADEQPADEQPADEQPADEQPADEQPAEDQPADEQPADEQPADEQPADEQPADEQPADEQPAGEEPADEELIKEEFIEEELTEEELTEEELTEEELTEEELTGEELTEEELTEEETPATPTDLEPVEIRLDAAESGVEAWITFMSDAGIPEGAELHVRELDAREQEAYQEQTARALNCDDESYLRYTKYLEFTLTCEGEALELNAPVTAYVTLPDVSEGLEALQVVRFGGATPELMDSGREGDTVSFGTDSFAVFGIGNALISITANETELAAVEVLGFSPDAPVSLTKTEDPEVEEGLEVLGTFTIENNTEAASEAAEQDGLWIRAELKQDAELDSMEGVALYRVEEDGSTDVLMEELSGDARIMELDVQQVAVVKDTGYRHLTLTVNPEGTEEAQSVTLDGMMPKGSEAAAEDVTDRFADYVSPEARTESGQPEEAPRAVLEASGTMEVAKKAAATKAGAAKTVETKAAETEAAVRETAQEGEADASSGSVTLAAYEISISHRDGEYQPDEDKPISVEIVDSRITAGRNIEVWHIRDDGTEEKVENFTVEDGKIVFEATGFSVYVVIAHEDDTEVVEARVEFHFISDKNITEHVSDGYFTGDPYRFANKSTDENQHIQTTQILKNGESLELIIDPANHKIDQGSGQEIYQYFYGWYVVNTHPVSGTTNEYGINTTNNKLYYDWPAQPSSITFESPISISVDNSGASPVVSWSLNGASGTGTPDKDGTVHVFLAPVFERYNFVNFLLYPKDSRENQGGTVNRDLMARKMIVMGSTGSAEVKISDIHATSKDPVHLVFMGWEYENENEEENSPNRWTQILTIDSSGHERQDPGRDGVYLTVSELEDAGSIDLYPLFVEARWVDFFVGKADSGASYVGSEYLRSWGPAMPAGSVPDEHSLNCFTSLNKSTRKGYVFDGWYAFANVDSNTGEITNLNQAENVTIKYVDVNDKYNLKTVTVNTTAVKVGNRETEGSDTVSINNCGLYSINGTDGGQGTLYINDDSDDKQPLFSGLDGKLKFYDALDRLNLVASWTPAESKVTIVYWTEDAQGPDYVPLPDNPTPDQKKAEYTSNAIRTITTTQLNDAGIQAQGSSSFASGTEIYMWQLQQYTDPEYGVNIVSTDILDDVGAVPKRADGDSILAEEGIFYELNYELSDTNKVINGDGETVFNVYYSRRTFHLVFHIGRDGYVKENGQQKEEYMSRPDYSNWDGNWIQFMFNDSKITSAPPDGLGYKAGPTARSYTTGDHVFSMTYTDPDTGNVKRADSTYVATSENVKGNYRPNPGENVYVISAKYGAYIGKEWPTPTNNNFVFRNPSGSTKTMYTWAAYYGSRYCYIAHHRYNGGDNQNNNPDVNGVYNYMSAELCTNRAGTGIINSNQVHHLVAYFGDSNPEQRGKIKHYHILYEAVDGTYDSGNVTLQPGTYYSGYEQTTWSEQHGQATALTGAGDSIPNYYEVSVTDVISNVGPKYQMGWEFDGYDYIYSCYNTDASGNHDVYFFYRPKQYTLTFMYENENDRKTDTYYYTESLANAKKPEYTDPQREGYAFLGWYTNEAGAGEPFDFAHETMPSSSLVLYPKMDVLRYWVKIDPNGGVIDHIDYNFATGLSGEGHNISQSTYIHPSYGTTISEYTIMRKYILLSDKEQTPGNANYYDGPKYYYVNTQFNENTDGDWGLHQDLRNAVYLTEQELNYYFNSYYVQVCQQNMSYYSNVQVLNWDQFRAAYVSGPYRPVEGEHYTFMGWYEVKDGRMSAMPFNFNDPITGPLELRAKWRLDGGYYIQYNPYYSEENSQGGTTMVIGDLDGLWTDPSYPNQQLYADQSPTQIREAPTNISSTDNDHSRKWVFRGWRVVRATQDTIYIGSTPYTVWEPIELVNGQPVYYQPGDHFTIDSDLATGVAPGNNPGHIIHMQAYYEPEEDTDRRPYVTNLILDANDTYGGYVNPSAGTLPTLDHPGTSAINTDTEIVDGHPTQILFGDIQSNLAVHLFRYATGKTNNDDVTGTNFFKHDNNYQLIGFDENANPEAPTTGNAYVPAYAADSVISVTRDDNITLYAMWEPMVYVTFENDTEKPITVNLNGTSTDTVRIVNKVTGEFGRQVASSSIPVPAGESVKIVLPAANVAQNEEITATVYNDHVRKKMSVSGVLGQTDPYGTGSTDIKYGSDVTYTGTLVSDPDGIVVTYTEKDDAQILYDVNGGTWTDACPPYQHLSGNIYDLDTENLHNNQYEPTDPTPPEGKIFIGWTVYPEIAAISDFSSTDPLTVDGSEVTVPEGSIQLDVVRDNYLWDFSENASELYNNGKTLYAVWSEKVTVTYNIAYSTNMTANPLLLHNWTGPATTTEPGLNVFYRESDTSPYITYSVAKGERVVQPGDPIAIQTENSFKNNAFMYWLIKDGTHNTDENRYKAKSPNADVFKSTSGNIFDFTQRVTQDTDLVTSWTNYQPQTFTFTIRNEVVNGNPNDEFDYTLSVVDDYVIGKLTQNNNEYGHPTKRWGSVTTKLKNDQDYTVTVTVYVGGSLTWEAYCTEIKVTDRNGVVIKDDRLFYCQYNNNQGKDYVGNYKYSLEIVQSEATGYTTTVLPNPDNNMVGSFEYTTNNDARMFEFGTTNRVTDDPYDNVHKTHHFNDFDPERNVYVADEHNSMLVIFHNERDAYVAPTGFASITKPFVLMLLAGLLLLTGLVIPVCIRKRRHGKAEACEAIQINYPGTVPPCPRANLWAQPTGSSGKRGGSV